MGKTKVERSGYRSLFWPVVLISVGVIWLLGNLGVLSAANFSVLFQLWPLILIIIGLDLLFGRESPVIGMLIGVGAVVLIIALMLVGPSLGLGVGTLDVTTSTFEEPRGDASSAQIELGVSVGSASISTLTDSNNLFEAEVAHVGELQFDARGETEKVISLRQNEVSTTGGFELLGFAFGGPEQDLFWNISLSPNVPLNLRVSGGVGQSTYDLSGLDITGLTMNIGVGEADIILPSTGSRYNASISNGVGEVRIDIEDGASVNMDINGGVGALFVTVPDDAGVRVDVNSGLGGVNVPSDWSRISGSDNDGVWESPSYGDATSEITISFDGGVGGLTVR